MHVGLNWSGPGTPSPAERRAAVRVAADRRASGWFVHAALFACLILQRFAVFAGDSPIYICLPVFLAGVAWMLATGRGEVRPVVAPLFALVVALGVVSTLVATNSNDNRVNGVSIASLFAVLAIYAGLVVRPSARFDASRTFDIAVVYIRICAALGIVQYLAQFAGVRLFSFLLAVPALKPVLVEPLFNYQPWLAYGSSILRSNGFFLVEPSVFSQVLMLGVIVDFFVRRDWKWLPLYGLAYLFTYAGTGLAALLITCALAIVLAPRQVPRLASFAAIGVSLLVIGAFAFPGQMASLLGRATELNYSGSSGYARYMTQFAVLDTIGNETRTLIGFGPGGFERAIFYTPGGSNAALKLFVDYGILGLGAFAVFLVGALWRRDIALVSLFALVNYQIGGGYLVFAPLVVLAAILCIWSGPPRTLAVRPARP